MRKKMYQSVAVGLALALAVTSVNIPAHTASAAVKKYWPVVEKAQLSAAKNIFLL